MWLEKSQTLVFNNNNYTSNVDLCHRILDIFIGSSLEYVFNIRPFFLIKQDYLNYFSSKKKD